MEAFTLSGLARTLSCRAHATQELGIEETKLVRLRAGYMRTTGAVPFPVVTMMGS